MRIARCEGKRTSSGRGFPACHGRSIGTTVHLVTSVAGDGAGVVMVVRLLLLAFWRASTDREVKWVDSLEGAFDAMIFSCLYTSVLFALSSTSTASLETWCHESIKVVFLSNRSSGQEKHFLLLW